MKVYFESRPCITELKTSSLGEIQFFNDNHSQGTLSVEISEEKETVCNAINRLLRVDERAEILNVSNFLSNLAVRQLWSRFVPMFITREM